MGVEDALVLAALILALLLVLAFPGYRPLLRMLLLLRGARPQDESDETPPVTLIISAYNEESVIGVKIENARALDYPDLRILVVSDASSDRTDEIVRKAAAADPRVELLRIEERGGKTSGLNVAMQRVQTPYVVFTDANAMFEPDAIRWLVRPFAGEKVGYVVGAALYSDEPGTTGGRTEVRYWNRELQIKKLESDLSCVVGADGAIYAIRRELYEPLDRRDINDFVNPMQIVMKGYRGVFEPRAVCREATTGSVSEEIARKRRIVNRSVAGLLRVRPLLNPFRYGVFSVQIWLHKVVRWISPLIALAIVVLLAGASVAHPLLRIPLALSVVGFCTLLVLPKLGVSGRKIPFLMEAIFAAGVSVASIQALLDVVRGRVAVTWQTKRTAGPHAAVRPFGAIMLSLALAIAPIGAVVMTVATGGFAAHVTWLAICLVGAAGHSFLYEAILRLTLADRADPPLPEPTEWPDATMVISAYNEEQVLAQKLKNALATRYPGRLRILVSSDGSSDATDAIAQRFAGEGIELYRNDPRTGKAGMLRRVVQNAVKTDVVVLSDCNAMYDPDAVARLVARLHSDPAIGAVTGNVLLVDPGGGGGEEDVILSRLEKRLMYLESLSGSCAGIDGAMVAVRRPLVPWYPDGTILDDFVLAMHVANSGHRVVYEHAAKGSEWSVETLKGEYERRARIMAGVFQLYRRGIGLPTARSGLLWRFLGHKVWRWCAPGYAIATAVILILLVGAIPGLAILSAAMVGLFALMAVRWSAGAAVRKMGYLLVYQAAAVTGVARGLFNLQSGLWKRTPR